jgi:hypothetical protein
MTKRKPLFPAASFSMGGTGLEPVPPACRDGAAVRARSLRCAQCAPLSEIQELTERSSEPERTPTLPFLPRPPLGPPCRLGVSLFGVVHHLLGKGPSATARADLHKNAATGYVFTLEGRAVLKSTVRSACKWVSRSAGCDDVARSSAARKRSPSSAFSAHDSPDKEAR